jgi:hypothetical protein
MEVDTVTKEGGVLRNGVGEQVFGPPVGATGATGGEGRAAAGGPGCSSCVVTPLLRLLHEEVGNMLEGASIQQRGLVERVVAEAVSRHGQEWSSPGGVAATPDWEFTSLPRQCSEQVVAVIKELEPSANLREASGYDDDNDDPFLPPPPSSSPLGPQPPSTFPPALTSLIGGGQGSQ